MNDESKMLIIGATEEEARSFITDSPDGTRRSQAVPDELWPLKQSVIGQFFGADKGFPDVEPHSLDCIVLTKAGRERMLQWPADGPLDEILRYLVKQDGWVWDEP